MKNRVNNGLSIYCKLFYSYSSKKHRHWKNLLYLFLQSLFSYVTLSMIHVRICSYHAVTQVISVYDQTNLFIFNTHNWQEIQQMKDSRIQRREEQIYWFTLLSLCVSWQWPTLPRKEYAVPSALEDLTSVFGMGTGVTPPPLSPGYSILLFRNLSQGSLKTTQCITSFFPTFLWSSPRLISISQLNVSLHLHTWPIYQIFLLVSYFLAEWEISS